MDEASSAEAVTVVGLASANASEIEIVSSEQQVPSSKRARGGRLPREYHVRNRLGGSAGSNAPLLRDEDLDVLRAQYAAGAQQTASSVVPQADELPQSRHVAALVSDDASDVVASVVATPVPPKPRSDEGAADEPRTSYTDVTTHGQEALPPFAQASQWALAVLDELSDSVVNAAEDDVEPIAAAAAAAGKTQSGQPLPRELPPARDDDAEAGAAPPPPQLRRQQQQEEEADDTFTVHVDLRREVAESGTPPLPPAQPVPPPQLALAPPATSSTAPPRTALHDLAKAWLASLVTSGGGSADAAPDVTVDRLFAAFDLSAAVVGGAIGAVMVASVKNDNGNMAVVRTALARRYTDASMQSLHALLSAEVAARVHKEGASGLVLRDPSCALSIVWLRRSLALQTGIIEGLVRERQQVRGLLISRQPLCPRLSTPSRLSHTISHLPRVPPIVSFRPDQPSFRPDQPHPTRSGAVDVYDRHQRVRHRARALPQLGLARHDEGRFQRRAEQGAGASQPAGEDAPLARRRLLRLLVRGPGGGGAGTEARDASLGQATGGT